MAKILLSNFDSKVSSTIVARGRQYYKNGNVMGMEEDAPGEWVAVVTGSNEYAVTVKLEGDKITMWDCTCPYDYDGMCKHVVAVLFELRKKLKDELPSSKELSYEDRLAKALNILKPADKTKSPTQKPPPQDPVIPPPAYSGLKPLAIQVTPSEYYDMWQQLDKTDQCIIKILSLTWEKCSAARIAEIYQFVKPENGRVDISNRSIDPVLSRLTDLRLIQRKGSEYFCENRFAHFLCEQIYSTDPEFKKIIQSIKTVIEKGTVWVNYADTGLIFRNLRFALYLEQSDSFQKNYEALQGYSHEWTKEHLINFWMPENENGWDNIERYPEGIRYFLLWVRLDRVLEEMVIPDPYCTYLESSIGQITHALREEMLEKLARLSLLRGNWEGLKRNMSMMQNAVNIESFNGILLLLKGQPALAHEVFLSAEKDLRKIKRTPKGSLQGLANVFYIYTMLEMQLPTLYPKIGEMLKKYTEYDTGENAIFYALQNVLRFLQNNKREAVARMSQFNRSGHLVRGFYHICCAVIDENLIDVSNVTKEAAHFESQGYVWLAREMRAIIAFKTGAAMPAGDTVPLVESFPKMEEWENALTELLSLGANAQAVQAKENDSRVVWLVDFEAKCIESKEQTFGKKGWTAGRAIAEERLHRKDVAGLSVQDYRIIDAMRGASWWYRIDKPEVWKSLAGHPLLFLRRSPEVAVQLVEEQPVLVARQVEDGYEMRFIPPVQKSGVEIVKETPTRYKLYIISPEHERVASAFNGKSLVVPERGFERFTQAMNGLSQLVTVQASFNMDQGDIPELPADPRICVHLLPVGNGFHVELYVKPFASNPPYFKPGKGETAVMALIDGQRVRTNRDLKAEKNEAKSIIQKLTFLSENKPEDQIWQVENANTCLEILTEIHPLLVSGVMTLEWPKGEKFTVANVVGMDQFRMKISQGNQWFEVSGELQIDEGKVLDMRELLALSEQQKSPFIEVGPGKFLAITAEFRKCLHAVSGLMNLGKNGTLQLHPLAATAFQTLTDVIKNADLDPAFLKNREKLKTAFAQKFKLPKKFNATLRPYQIEGFEWLHRMAAWGAGACLADDMGLGKTIQALAFLTDRAASGPALVVAPVSVCRNWVNETRKFAPLLNPLLLSEGDRETVIKKAKKGDLIITTYDLLNRESNLLKDKKWATVVLDEAQAIKNRLTKRSDAAMQLQADFRLMMSGTPVENHLGELWNLFHFANPGLLGSIEQFSTRFSGPIEKYGDENRRDQLRRLVQPFILRRRKDEVLKELPAKTEITLQVELTPEERAFYEALRRKALESLESDSMEAGAGEKHLLILAQITKLRRAACHPKLADENAGIMESSKQRLFAEIVEELIENGHKALVFSQFVSHLAILEKYLKKQKIAYQYLDGQTPPPKRQERIDAFQRGEGDLFLISLKAGGSGLNLTAADYVIHMDPWWNPAVEDQATDRAHRIGQEKPVTVYRLVTEGTIEEKIIQLHERKRDLADSLLSGTGVSAKLSADELMALLKEDRDRSI